jgi:hypothetical protein
VFGYPNWALKWWEKKRVKYEGEREREREKSIKCNAVKF